MKKISQHWHNHEKHNYPDNLHHHVYKMYTHYYTGGNPYNLLQTKYQKRLQDIDIVFI